MPKWKSVKGKCNRCFSMLLSNIISRKNIIYKIKMVNVEYDGLGVDIPEDINRVEKLMKKDKLLSKYNIK